MYHKRTILYVHEQRSDESGICNTQSGKWGTMMERNPLLDVLKCIFGVICVRFYLKEPGTETLNTNIEILNNPRISSPESRI